MSNVMTKLCSSSKVDFLLVLSAYGVMCVIFANRTYFTCFNRCGTQNDCLTILDDTDNGA